MRKLKTKTIPCLVMLIGGVATMVITYLYQYSSRETLEVLLISLLACYFVGTLIKTALDRIEIPIPEEENIEEDEEDNEDENAEEIDDENEESEDSFQEESEYEEENWDEFEDSGDESEEFVLDEGHSDDDILI